MRRRGKRGARGAWIATVVMVALIGALAAAQFGAGSAGPAAGTTTAATGTAAAASPGGTGTGGVAGAGGAGGGATASAAATTTATATASGAAGAETGGPLGVVRRYFAALAAANYPAAYALLAPAYRSGHTLAAFVTGLPAKAPALGSATVTSVANFHATVQIAITPAGGGAAATETLQLVDVNAAATKTVAASWLLQAPPAGAGG